VHAGDWQAALLYFRAQGMRTNSPGRGCPARIVPTQRPVPKPCVIKHLLELAGK